MESCPSGRRCSTRNAVWGNSPRVRIPNSPPEKVVTASAVTAFCLHRDSKGSFIGQIERYNTDILKHEVKNMWVLLLVVFLFFRFWGGLIDSVK